MRKPLIFIAVGAVSVLLALPMVLMLLFCELTWRASRTFRALGLPEVSVPIARTGVFVSIKGERLADAMCAWAEKEGV